MIGPRRNFKATRTSLDQANAGAHMEKRGDFGELSRPVRPGQGDFVDETGQSWDIKGFDDTRPSRRGNYVPSPQNDAKIAEKMNKQFDRGRRVILDTRYLTGDNEADLRRIVGDHGWEAQGLVKWYP